MAMLAGLLAYRTTNVPSHRNTKSKPGFQGDIPVPAAGGLREGRLSLRVCDEKESTPGGKILVRRLDLGCQN